MEQSVADKHDRQKERYYTMVNMHEEFINQEVMAWKYLGREAGGCQASEGTEWAIVIYCAYNGMS